MTRLLAPAVAIVLSIPAAASAADGRLIDAVKRQDVAAVERLLKAGTDVNVALADGTTALHWAAYLDDLPLADRLLRAKANVNAANELQVTPLMLACENRSAPMVDRLL